MSMTQSKLRRAADRFATVAVTGGIGLLAVVGRGEAPAAAATNDVTSLPPLPPLPLGARALRGGPLNAQWTYRSVDVTALRVRLDATGAHTHDNWIFYRLPFDSNDPRIRNVSIRASAMTDPDVASVRVAGACLPCKTYGPIGTWAGYTTGAVGPTLAFTSHPSPPTDDPTIYGLNVPSRVANYVACGWEKSEVLRDPATWHLEVAWEER
jgi:hypothetical protein